MHEREAPPEFPHATATLKGRLVTLRPVSLQDYPQLFAWRSSFDTIHMLNFRRRLSSYEEFVRELDSLLGGTILLLVRDARSNRSIGYVIAHTISAWDGWAGVGMFVEKGWRFRGHGAEAAILATDAFFHAYPLKKILTEVYEFAPDTLSLARAMGFEEAGYLPDHYWHGERWWGLYNMVLTRESWLRHRDRLIDIAHIQERFSERPDELAEKCET